MNTFVLASKGGKYTMPNIGDSERKTQNRVVKFFRDKLHYTYLGNLHDSENRNIMQEQLHAWLLKQGYSEKPMPSMRW